MIDLSVGFLIDHVRDLIDLSSFGLVAATLLNLLPQIAAALSIMWTLWRFVEAVKEKRAKRAKAKTGEG